MAELLKLASVVIGVVDVGLAANKYVKESREEYFLAIVIILLALSVILLLLGRLGKAPDSKIDAGYHVIGGLLLLIGAIVWFVSVNDYAPVWRWISGGGDGANIQRICAGILGALNSLIYLVIGGMVFKNGGSGGSAGGGGGGGGGGSGGQSA